MIMSRYLSLKYSGQHNGISYKEFLFKRFRRYFHANVVFMQIGTRCMISSLPVSGLKKAFHAIITDFLSVKTEFFCGGC